MKKKSLILVCLLLFSGLSMLTFSSCDKDTDSYLHVTVVNGNSTSPISNVSIEVYPEGGNIKKHTGKTDVNGEYMTSFKAPSIVTINAKYIVEDLCTENQTAYRKTTSSARLKEGEIVELIINMPTKIEYQ